MEFCPDTDRSTTVGVRGRNISTPLHNARKLSATNGAGSLVQKLVVAHMEVAIDGDDFGVVVQGGVDFPLIT